MTTRHQMMTMMTMKQRTAVLAAPLQLGQAVKMRDPHPPPHVSLLIKASETADPSGTGYKSVHVDEADRLLAVHRPTEGAEAATDEPLALISLVLIP